MSEAPNQHGDDRLEAYLDGLMSAVERAAFERELETSAELRAAVERQRQIDGSLARRFAPPSAEQVLARVRARVGGAASREAIRTPESAARRRLWFLRGLAAAAVLAFVAGGWLVWRTWLAEPEIPLFLAGPPRTLLAAYQEKVADGLEPHWVCKNDQEFQEAFRYKLGQKLSLATLPEDIQAVGLRYMNTISVDTVVLLARVRGEPVLVFVDRAEKDTGQELPADSPLHLFRDRIGDLALYELTPLDEPYVTEYLSAP